MADPPAEPEHVTSAAPGLRPIRTIHDVMDIHVERYTRDGITRTIKDHQRLDLVEGRYSDRNALGNYNKIGARLQPGATYHDRLGSVYSVRPQQKRASPAEPLPSATVVQFRVVEAEPQSEDQEPEEPLQIEGDVEPWGWPVDGVELLNAIHDAFNRFVVLPPGAAEVLAVFPVETHALDLCEYRPQITVKSPVKRTGKTKVLRVLGPLCRRSLPASNISLATLYHSTDANAPTLLMDEGETYIPQNRQMIGVLNSGHERTEAWTMRMDMTTKVRRRFKTFAPLVIACIKNMPETIEDRSIVLRMQRKRPDQHVERFRPRDVEPLRVLARKAARWVADHKAELEDADPPMPASWHDRLQDIARMAVTICDVAGGPWPELIRSAITSLLGMQSAAAEPGEILLADLRDYMDDPKQPERRRPHHRFRSADMVEHLVGIERWGDINTAKLALTLEPFGITPEAMRVDGKSTRGYLRAQFDEVFAAYVPKTATRATPATPRETVAPVAAVAASADSDTRLTEAEAAIGALYMAEVAEARPKRRYWRVPPELLAEYIAEFGPQFFDVAPHPQPEWDGLTIEWIRAGATWVWCHPPFTKSKVVGWVRKAVAERDKGRLVVMLLPDFQVRAKDILQKAGAEIRPAGTPIFLDLETGEPNPKPGTTCFFAILRSEPPAE